MASATIYLIVILAIAAFFYDVQAAPVERSSTAINTLGSSEQTSVRVKRNGGCGCCGCGCCGCGGGGGCGCCCCRPKCCCRCTCCRTCCCTRCCTCCRPCCCGCGCGCCGCGGGRKRRALQNLKIKLANKQEKAARDISGDIEKTAINVSQKKKRATIQTTVGNIVDVPEWPNAYGYY